MAIGVICQECEHQNPGENRYCGMCGALLAKTATVRVREPVEVAPDRRAKSERAAAAPISKQREIAEDFVAKKPRTTEPPAERPRPSGVSGPSFLGLNQPYSDEGRYRDDDDDLYGSSWGGRVAIVFIILLVVAALGYLQWRSTQREQQAKPAPIATPEQAPPVNAPPSDPAGQKAAATSPTGAAQGSNAAVSYGAPTGETPSQPGADPAAQSNIGGVPSTPSSNSNAQIPQSDKADETSRDGSGGVGGKTLAPNARGANAQAARDAEAFSQDAVNQAEVYLQGKGIPQNCDEGIGILRAAEARGNIPAIVKLGALYATGACVPVSRVAAYHFFTRAYRMEPHGDLLEHNRVMLWDEMSDGERQQASDQDGPLQ